MSITSVSAPESEVTRHRARRVWLWVLAAAAAAVTIGVVLVLMVGSEEPTYAYELNRSLDEEGGGPPVRAVGPGEVRFGETGYLFGPMGGLAVDLDLGESYTVEMRVRLDTARRWVKVFDFADRFGDAGLYLQDGTLFHFAFQPEWCPTGVEDISQGCRPVGSRWPLYGPSDALDVGSFATIRFIRDGDAGTVEVFVDDTLQTWSPAGIWHSYDRHESDPTEEELLALERVDWVEDYKKTLVPRSVLHVMTDDHATGGAESTSGEIDYIYITIP